MTVAIEMNAERNKNITETIKAISKRLFSFIKQRVASTEDAEDILQDVFYQFAGNPEPIEQATGWLYKVADSTPETEYLRNIFWEELKAALDELPASQRDVFIQNEIEGVPFKEISEQTGEAVATLISRKRYAVVHLRERLRELKNELLNY